MVIADMRKTMYLCIAILSHSKNMTIYIIRCNPPDVALC